MKFARGGLLTVFIFLALSSIVYAFCPVFTITAASFVGLSHYLSVDDTIVIPSITNSTKNSTFDKLGRFVQKMVDCCKE